MSDRKAKALRKAVAMQAENVQRAHLGQSICYNEQAFLAMMVLE